MGTRRWLLAGWTAWALVSASLVSLYLLLPRGSHGDGADLVALVLIAAGLLIGLVAGPRGSSVAAVVLLLAALGSGYRLVLPELELDVTRTRSNEARVLRELTSLAEAQKRYAALSGGYFEANLECLTRTQLCLPGMPEAGPLWNGTPLSVVGTDSGYMRAFVPRGWVGAEGDGSPTRVRSFVLLALPTDGDRGRVSFCLDQGGVWFSRRGHAPAAIDGRCAR